MKTQKSGEYNLNESLNDSSISHDNSSQLGSNIQSESGHFDESSDEKSLEGTNRRDRRCRKILDTIG
jgi:hypothetical protein